MTSSFSMPGGNTVLSLFRAEPLLSLGKHSNDFTVAPRRGKVPTRWVYMENAASPEAMAPIPPTREADYVGQVIAVASPVTSAQA